MVKHIFTAGEQKNFCPPCSHLLSDLGEIWHKGSAHYFLSIYEFREKGHKSPYSLISVNKITLMRVP